VDEECPPEQLRPSPRSRSILPVPLVFTPFVQTNFLLRFFLKTPCQLLFGVFFGMIFSGFVPPYSVPGFFFLLFPPNSLFEIDSLYLPGFDSCRAGFRLAKSIFLASPLPFFLLESYSLHRRRWMDPSLAFLGFSFPRSWSSVAAVLSISQFRVRTRPSPRQVLVSLLFTSPHNFSLLFIPLAPGTVARKQSVPSDAKYAGLSVPLSIRDCHSFFAFPPTNFASVLRVDPFILMISWSNHTSHSLTWFSFFPICTLALPSLRFCFYLETSLDLCKARPSLRAPSSRSCEDTAGLCSRPGSHPFLHQSVPLTRFYSLPVPLPVDNTES